MPIELVNVGSLPNDGQGDPLRVAYQKINQSLTYLASLPGQAAPLVNEEAEARYNADQAIIGSIPGAISGGIDGRLANETTPDADAQKLSTPADVVRRIRKNSVATVPDKAAMAALATGAQRSAALNGDNFYWTSGDMSAWVSRDPTKSVFIPPATDTSGASGAWARRGPWALGTVEAEWFGYVADSTGATGSGTDNTAALQAAIDFVCPFVWKGTTRATELQGNTSGQVILPKGIARITSKIRLAPNLHIRGQTSGNDFTVRTGIGGTSSGLERMGSAIFCDIADFSTYAFDACPYDANGDRLDDAITLGGDSFDGLKTQVPNIRFSSLTIYGNWTCKGLNMAGAESSRLDPDVLIRGFTVGARYTASWYAKCQARILASWRGIITYLAATDLDISGCSLWRPAEAPVYDPAVSGYDGTEPTIDSWWTAAVLKRSAGIYNFYGNVAGFNVAVELFDYSFMSKNAVSNIRSIYTEMATTGIIFTEGPDQQNENFEFDSAFSSTAPFLFTKNARVNITVLRHNYSEYGYSRVLGDYFNTIGYEAIPVLNGIKLVPGGDTVFDDQFIAHGGLRQYQGAWTPTPKFGGVDADTGTGVKTGRWTRIGNIVRVSGHITIPTLTAATGAFTIEGLPFEIRSAFGLDAYAGVSFFYATPTLTKGRGTAGGYDIVFDGITHSGFVNGADIRFEMTYETNEGGPWGW